MSVRMGVEATIGPTILSPGRTEVLGSERATEPTTTSFWVHVSGIRWRCGHTDATGRERTLPIMLERFIDITVVSTGMVASNGGFRASWHALLWDHANYAWSQSGTL